MPSTIWNKYKKLKEINNNSNIKTYLARIEPIIKEILPKNKDEYYTIYEHLEEFKEKIYEIVEENQKIYIVIDNNEELMKRIDDLILSDNIIKQVEIEGKKAISKNEIFNLFKMEKSMCKIKTEIIKNNKLCDGIGTGFFCELNKFPIKYCLFTNNHVLNNIEVGNTIKFECLKYQQSLFNSSYSLINKEIEISQERKVFTNKELDYTCIELFESDGIRDYFKIDENIFKNKESLKDNDIFILQYPKGNNISFSNGKILSIKDKMILHNASTVNGASGSPIIRRSENNYIIGLHYGGYKNKIYNIGTPFDSILNDIKEQINEINCIFYGKEIDLLHDFNEDINKRDDEFKKLYLESRDLNKKIFEENIELYINNKKFKFDYKYKNKDSKEIKVKLKFKKKLTNTSFMFYWCSSLKSIDLSSFNTSNVNNMSYMFSWCESLKSIDLSSFNTSNVNNMSYMFYWCRSLKSIDLSSFNTIKINNMSHMFSSCESLKSIDLSSFNTINVNNMNHMFSSCQSLKSLDLSSFNTINVNNMSHMFFCCRSLKSLDLSSFNTINVNNMSQMFGYLESMERENIIIKNTEEKLLSEIKNELKEEEEIE